MVKVQKPKHNVPVTNVPAAKTVVNMNNKNGQSSEPSKDVSALLEHLNAQSLLLSSEKGQQSAKPVIVEDNTVTNVESGSQTLVTAASEQPVMKQNIPLKQPRPSFVSLFKNNRSAHSKYKLKFVNTGEEMLDFDDLVIDTVEDTFGICLLGFIVGGKPPTAALVDLVKRWGPNVQFQTNSSGWTTFIFPSVELRDKILNEGQHMVFGYHLFLKEMPRYFRYSDEDMNTLPSWVRIHGIPPSCWNEHILSRVASKIGNPVHMDMLTHDRKRKHYARVLIEVDNSKPRVEKLNIRIPIGIIELKFEYESDMEHCNYCQKLGHRTVDCLLNPGTTAMDTAKGEGNTGSNGDNANRDRSRSIAWRTQGPRGRSRAYHPNRNARSRTRKPPATNQRRPEPLKQPTKNKFEELENDIELRAETEGMQNHTVDETQQPAGTKGKTVVDDQVPCSHTTDKESTVKHLKNDKTKRNKSKNRKNKDEIDDEAELSLLNTNLLYDMDDTSSSNTELVNADGSCFFGSAKKGRHPQGASGNQ